MCAVAAIEFENNGAGADEEPDESCKQVEGKKSRTACDGEKAGLTIKSQDILSCGSATWVQVIPVGGMFKGKQTKPTPKDKWWDKQPSKGAGVTVAFEESDIGLSFSITIEMFISVF